jgi:hypothetical protein
LENRAKNPQSDFEAFTNFYLMKGKIIFILLIINTLSCSTSKKILHLQNQVTNLKTELWLVQQKTEELSSFRFWLKSPQGNKFPIIDPTKGLTYDSLCTKYNNLLDKYIQLHTPYFALEKNFNIDYVNTEATILKLKSLQGTFRK